MLLVLYDAPFLDFCLIWTAKKVSNLHCAETPQLARYFSKGLAVGDAPIFKGLCVCCARLLGGPTDRIVGSKVGAPIDRYGKKLVDARGAAHVHSASVSAPVLSICSRKRPLQRLLTTPKPID